MELVKIHGGEDKIEMPKNSTTVQVLDLEGSNHTFQSLDNSEPVDAGAIEHSSDSDYDPRNDSAEMLLQAVTVPGGPKGKHFYTVWLKVLIYLHYKITFEVLKKEQTY